MPCEDQGKVYKAKVIASGIFSIINITVPYATCSDTPIIVIVGSKEEIEAGEKEECEDVAPHSTTEG